MRMLYSLILAALVISPVLGCGGESGTEGSSGDRTSGDAGGSVGEAAGAVEQAGGQVEAALDRYKTGALARLDQYESGLSSLKETAESLSNDELSEAVQGIEQKLSDARGAANGLEAETLADLDAQKNQLDSRLNEIKGDIDRAQEKIPDLKGNLPKVPGQG